MYFICDKKGDKYGIKDTVDGKVEYYTEQEIKDMRKKGIYVKGATLKTVRNDSYLMGGVKTIEWKFYVFDERVFTTPDSMLSYEDIELLIKPVKKALDNIVGYWNFCGWLSTDMPINIKSFSDGFVGYRKCVYISKTNSFHYSLYAVGYYDHITDSFKFDSFRIEVLDKWDRLYMYFGSPIRETFPFTQDGVNKAGQWLQSLQIDNELPNAREYWKAWEKHVRSVNNPIRKLFGNK